MSNITRKDLLSQLLYEAQSYQTFEDIEKLVEGRSDLAMIPLQPISMALKHMPVEQLSLIIPRLSSEQRQGLRDLDCWNKDELNFENGNFWLRVYAQVKDEACLKEFVTGEDFLLLLKSQVDISTFDEEDPQYPEHENFFLTEDHLLLIEYPENFSYAEELKFLLRTLYAELGVENAYQLIFKTLTDSYQEFLEQNYHDKKERLRDFGFVDYFEAIELLNSFRDDNEWKRFFKNKNKLTPQIEPQSLNQVLHSSVLNVYQSGLDQCRDDLNRVTDEKRLSFLHFNFIRLVNSQITLDGSLEQGSMALLQSGQRCIQYLELGFDKIKKEDPTKVLFETFDFFDFYRLGKSLLEIEQKKIKKSLSLSGFDKNPKETFLGMYWNSFLEESLQIQPHFKFDGSTKSQLINSVDIFQTWCEWMDTLRGMLAYIDTFYESLENIKNEATLSSSYYLNYTLDTMDFESLVLSSLINFEQGHLKENSKPKLGVDLVDLKSFYKKFFFLRNDEWLLKDFSSDEINSLLNSFISSFGFSKVSKMPKYLYQIMIEQMNGYEIDKMLKEDFKHVGGPVILVS